MIQISKKINTSYNAEPQGIYMYVYIVDLSSTSKGKHTEMQL